MEHWIGGRHDPTYYKRTALTTVLTVDHRSRTEEGKPVWGAGIAITQMKEDGGTGVLAVEVVKSS